MIINAFDYLMQVRRLECRIQRLEMKAQELRSCLLPSAIRYDKDKVQTSPEERMSEVVSELIEVEKEIELDKHEKGRVISETTAMIETLSDDLEKTVLTSFFVAREPMRETADRIGYGIRRTYQFRKSGIQHLDERLHTLQKQM